MTPAFARRAGRREAVCDAPAHPEVTVVYCGPCPPASRRSPPGIPPERYYAQVVERITALAGQGCNAPAITRVLRCEGYTMAPGRSDPLSLTTVRRLLRENVRPARRRPAAAAGGESLAADEWWLQDLAVELSMPSITLYAWARRGWVTVARKESRPPYRLILRAGRAELDLLRARRPRADGQPLAAGAVRLAR